MSTCTRLISLGCLPLTATCVCSRNSDLRDIDAELHPKYAPCGALIPNCKIFILNSSDMSRVGIGEPGEVFIGEHDSRFQA